MKVYIVDFFYSCNNHFCINILTVTFKNDKLLCYNMYSTEKLNTNEKWGINWKIRKHLQHYDIKIFVTFGVGNAYH